MNVVPYTTILVFDEQGEYENIDFVDLSRTSGGYALSSWLWQPLGFSKEQWARSQPWQLPLMRELKAAVSGRRVKRNRQGQFLNAEGNLNAKVSSATVRGRALKLLYDPRKIMVDLVESEDTLAWFVKELLGEMCLGGADDPGDHLVAAAGSAEDAPGNQLAEETLRSLCAQAGRSVCFDRKHNRFKVGKPPRYTRIRGGPSWRNMALWRRWKLLWQRPVHRCWRSVALESMPPLVMATSRPMRSRPPARLQCSWTTEQSLACCIV